MLFTSACGRVSPERAAAPFCSSQGVARLALVVFVDRTEVPWLRILRRGFRHCFTVLEQEQGLWTICEPLKHRMEVTLVEPPSLGALAAAYLEMGHRVCLGRRRVLPRPGWPPVPVPLTCVTIVKRLVGLRASHVLTPYQLHRHLMAHPVAVWVELSDRNLCLTYD
jgi:hypothetical protein